MKKDAKSEEQEQEKVQGVKWRVRVKLTYPEAMTEDDVRTGVTNTLKQYGAIVTRVKEAV